MIRRIQITNDLLDVIKSCPSGVIDDIYKIEYYIQGCNTVYDAKFTKEGDCLKVVLPSSELEKLENGILMRRAYYKVSDSSYPDGYYNLTFEDNMNVWLGGESSDPYERQYVTEKDLNKTLEDYALKTEVPSLDGYATQEWVESKGYVTAETLPEGIATESWVTSQGYLTEHQSLDGYATEEWVNAHGYLTTHQPIKTVNNQSLIGEGNIDISGMTPTQEAAIAPLMNPEEGIIVHTVYKPNVLVENKDLYLGYQWAEHQSEIDGDFYCINDGKIFKFNKKTYIYDKLNDSYIPFNYNILWKDNSGRYYVGNDSQIDMNTLQLTPVDLKLYSFQNDRARSNIWKGQYGIYQLSDRPQKFDEDNQRFVDWPNVNITEGYALEFIASYFGKYSFTYEGHIIMVYDDGSMWEMTEYEDHIDIDKVDNPYFPVEYNGTILQGNRLFNSNGILYYFGSNISKPLKLVNGNWVEFSIYDKYGSELYYDGSYYPGIFYGNILLGGCFYNNLEYFYFVNLSSEDVEYTIWQNVNTVAVDLDSQQAIRGFKSFQNGASINSLSVEIVNAASNSTSFNLNNNRITANSIEITSPAVTVNNKPIADKTDVVLNSTELPYGFFKSETINVENSVQIMNEQSNHFRTHTGRWIAYYNGGYYEFNGTGFQLVKSDVPNMYNYSNAFVVVTPNMTFYNYNGYTYIWDDINSTFIQVCDNLGDEQWVYWWDGTNLRHRGDHKLVNTNDTWKWVEDTINDYISGMYHYVNSRVIILTIGDNKVLEYNPSNKTYTQLGYYTPWTDTSFTVGNDIIWPWNGQEYRVLDLSKVTQGGDNYIYKSTSIPWSEYNNVHIEFQGHLWYGVSGYSYVYQYCYDINYEKPEVPATDGEYVLTGTRDGDSVTYSWETAQGGGSTPDLSSYATKTWVTEQGYLTEHQDLSSYALKSEIPSLTGYATKTWVTEQGYLTEHQSLADYATQSWATSQFLEESKIWTGSQSAWDALTSSQKASYTIALITE